MKCCILASLALGAAVIAIADHVRAQFPSQAAVSQGTTAVLGDPDGELIVKAARNFADAFNKGDARAVAALWTENGESREASGRTFLGRAAIEKAYAELFRNNAGGKIEVLVKSVRFPARDLAVEEGLLRQTLGPKDLPATTAYVTVHVRENGQWKIALASEGGVGQDRLEDLHWLLGDWTARVKDDTIKLSFVRDPKKPLIAATFTRITPGKDPVGGSVRIALDPETGQIRSWGFEDDGAHSQSLWTRDGKSWLLDSRGVLADGTPTAERIVLQRVSPDMITWRSIDRVVGDTRLADTVPMRLTRLAFSKVTLGDN